ncbi:hypothetical protein PENTCL1PPCAC_18083, partial [Pristionchus entomophagus]
EMANRRGASADSVIRPPLMEIQLGTDQPICCTCNQISSGEMVCCENGQCKVQYHHRCIGMEEGPPDGVNWFCEKCRPAHTHIPNQYDYGRNRAPRGKRRVVMEREEEERKEKEKKRKKGKKIGKKVRFNPEIDFFYR